MNTLLFLIVLAITFISYVLQFYKVHVSKSSIGISLQSYVITFIAISILTFNADVKEVFYLGLAEMILAIYGIVLIYYYREDLETTSKAFFVALGASFLMIHGVAQGIKSYQHKNKTTVSINSYSLWILMDGIIIYFTKDFKIIIALVISILIYLYIIADATIKNKLYTISND